MIVDYVTNTAIAGEAGQCLPDSRSRFESGRRTKKGGNINFSESQMGEIFHPLLARGLPGLPAFDGVYPEILCRQGQPDFIAVRYLDPDPELWTFELKLHDHRRAIWQAKQARAHSDRSVIVIPPGREKSYVRHREVMHRWDIWLSTFDPETGEFRIIRKGREKAVALSPDSKRFTLRKIEKIIEEDAIEITQALSILT